MTSFDTPAPDGYRFRRLTGDDRRALIDLDTWAFPMPTHVDDFDDVPLPLTWERTVGVEPVAGPGDDGRGRPLAGMHASYPFSRFGVPGGELPTAGLTWVGVHPQHRRRGMLSAMIDLHLARCRERGEPLSALFAAEAAIYGRFGYGKAADDLRLSIPRGAALRDVPGAAEHTVRVEHADRARHGDLVARLHRDAGASAGATGSTGPGGRPARPRSCGPASGAIPRRCAPPARSRGGSWWSSARASRAVTRRSAARSTGR
ncbi:GNAT family N-acetyltransferase [Isoptericola sp. BMS4]|uniref:GNAT family N-acetyltransferase n=1 Tax=Isoptericola sp. BMS4 TaxID=2527875 RepID=UPI001F10CD5B|nr:GNAT family N-acetyltransferase [Isoptericola sp. BMS4]